MIDRGISGQAFNCSFVLLLAATMLTASAPNDAHAKKGLGQFSEWSEPVNLGPTINTEFEDRQAAVSPSGLSLYFASDRPGGFGAYDLYVSQRSGPNDSWGPPQNLGPTINTADSERAPNFSPDGHLMFFTTDRPGYCGGFDLFVSWRKDSEDDFGWESPTNLGCSVNTEFDDGAPGYFQDPNTGIVSLYVTNTRPDGVGPPDIYLSTLRRDGSFRRAALVWELSTTHDDGRTAIRLDGLEVFFHSDRPGGVGQFNNIWTSTRETPQDAWSRPVNLGPVVNSMSRDAEPALSADGTELYFNSDRPGGSGGRDLYVTRRQRL